MHENDVRRHMVRGMEYPFEEYEEIRLKAGDYGSSPMARETCYCTACGIDGLQYPATELTVILTDHARDPLGYIRGCCPRHLETYRETQRRKAA